MASSTLVLRMASSSLDPTIISSDENGIYLQQGTGETYPLTNSQVRVAQFEAVKYENPNAHAIVQINMALTYNSQSPYQQITRALKIAIGRVSAATFDDSLVPNADNSFSIGIASTNRWRDINISNLLNVGQLTIDPVAGAQNGSIYYNTASNAFRGYASGAWSALGGVGWAASSTDIYNTNSGNVGIGTTVPGVKLEVNGNGELIRLDGTVGQDRSIYLRNVGAGIAKIFTDGTLTLETNAVKPITFNISSAEKMRINSDGNVGIGTTNPTNKLQVGTTLHVNDTSGRVGIGYYAGAPPTLLTVFSPSAQAQNGTVTKFNDLLKLTYQTNYVVGGQAQFWLGRWEDSGIDARSVLTLSLMHGAGSPATNADTDVMTWRSNGNVGIGVTDPGHRLSLKGTDSGAETLELINSNNTNSFTLGAGGDNFSIKDKRAGTTPFFIQYDGKVGIGTTDPGATLEVKGTMKIFGAWETRSNNTVYQAATDGFLVGSITARQLHSYIYTDSSNPPTTARVDIYTWDGVFMEPFSVPVKKGDYYKMSSQTEAGWVPSAFWIPLGT